MSEKAGSTPTLASSAQVATKKPAAKATKPRVKSSHPPTAEMVLAAIQNLKERNGSSLQAIKKYIAATYKLEVEKQAPFIKKYLKNAVDGGSLVRTKGKGASGSFKLPSGKTESKAKPKVAAAKKPMAKKPLSPKKVKVTAAEKKAVAAKKPSPAKKAAVKKPAAKKAVVAAVKTATPKPAKKSIAKKSVKSPAKPKAPKAKKASPARARTAAKKK